MTYPRISNAFGATESVVETLSAFDGVDTDYRFSVYSINARPNGLCAVYMFCSFVGSTYTPIYIGRADNLHSRLSGHERKSEAILHGASHLLVHVPGTSAHVDFKEAERRLIAHYQPYLNSQFR